jgi:hypothetical protein
MRLATDSEWARATRRGWFRLPARPAATKPTPKDLLTLPAGLPQASAFRAAWGRFPAKVRAMSVAVELVPPAKWPAHLAANCGFYESTRFWPWPKRATIKIRQHPGCVTLSLFLHECGHVAHYDVLTNAQREDWRRFWQANRDRMTEYGRRDEREGFAEAWVQAFWGQAPPPAGYRPVSVVVTGKVRGYFQ